MSKMDICGMRCEECILEERAFCDEMWTLLVEAEIEDDNFDDFVLGFNGCDVFPLDDEDEFDEDRVQAWNQEVYNEMPTICILYQRGRRRKGASMLFLILLN